IARPVSIIKPLLTTHPDLDALLMNGRIHFGGNSLDDSTGVVFGLQQPRHVIRRVTGNSRCFLFQPDVRIQGQIFVLSPPALLASATGEAHEISRRGLVNLVKGTQVADISQARATRPGLHWRSVEDRVASVISGADARIS